MLEAGPVTALALYVVVPLVLRGSVAHARGGDSVPLVTDRMAPLTERLLAAAGLERGPGVGMGRLFPLPLLGNVAIAARRATGRRS